jgi:hypothetical protein
LLRPDIFCHEDPVRCGSAAVPVLTATLHVLLLGARVMALTTGIGRLADTAV